MVFKFCFSHNNDSACVRSRNTLPRYFAHLFARTILLSVVYAVFRPQSCKVECNMLPLTFTVYTNRPKSRSGKADNDKTHREKLLDRVRVAAWIKHYSIRAEQAYVSWAQALHLLPQPATPPKLEISMVSPYLSGCCTQPSKGSKQGVTKQGVRPLFSNANLLNWLYHDQTASHRIRRSLIPYHKSGKCAHTDLRQR